MHIFQGFRFFFFSCAKIKSKSTCFLRTSNADTWSHPIVSARWFHFKLTVILAAKSRVDCKHQIYSEFIEVWCASPAWITWQLHINLHYVGLSHSAWKPINTSVLRYFSQGRALHAANEENCGWIMFSPKRHFSFLKVSFWFFQSCCLTHQNAECSRVISIQLRADIFDFGSRRLRSLKK